MQSYQETVTIMQVKDHIEVSKSPNLILKRNICVYSGFAEMNGIQRLVDYVLDEYLPQLDQNLCKYAEEHEQALATYRDARHRHRELNWYRKLFAKKPAKPHVSHIIEVQSKSYTDLMTSCFEVLAVLRQYKNVPSLFVFEDKNNIVPLLIQCYNVEQTPTDTARM